MTSLLEKMKRKMLIIGFSESTQQHYIKEVMQLYNYYNKSLTDLSGEELESYLLHLKKKKLAPNSHNVAVCALRFFYSIVLQQPSMKIYLPTTRVTYKLPSILSTEEVKRIIKATHNIKYKALLMVIYSAGLRVSEAVNLRIKDIDSDQMMLHIRCGKTRKERYTLLSSVALKYLRAYWKCCKFTDYVFPGNDLNTPIRGNVKVRATSRHFVKINL